MLTISGVPGENRNAFRAQLMPCPNIIPEIRNFEQKFAESLKGVPFSALSFGLLTILILYFVYFIMSFRLIVYGNCRVFVPVSGFNTNPKTARAIYPKR